MDNQHYNEHYFAAQLSKSDAKVAWQYGHIFNLAGLQPTGRILDVGCGAGPGLRYLIARGAQAVGVDLVYYPLVEAQRLTPTAMLVQTDVGTGLPFAEKSFDILLLSELIEHLANGQQMLRECHRILRPGGYIIVTTPNLWDIRRLIAPLTKQTWSGHVDPTHINLYTPMRLVQELKTAGFTHIAYRTGLKPIFWVSSKQLRVRLAVPYPPYIGNGLLAKGMR